MKYGGWKNILTWKPYDLLFRLIRFGSFLLATEFPRVENRHGIRYDMYARGTYISYKGSIGLSIYRSS